MQWQLEKSAWQVIGSGTDALFSGLSWAVYAYFAGQLVGSKIGMSDDNTNALSTSMTAGFGTYKMLSTYKFAGDRAWVGSDSFFSWDQPCNS